MLIHFRGLGAKLFRRKCGFENKNWAAFASEASAPEVLETFRTSENDPTKQNELQLGRFYSIPEHHVQLLHTYCGLPKEFLSNCETFGEHCMMVRRPFLDIKQCIEAYEGNDKPALRFLLYGIKGSGKSMTLAHILHYGYLKQYILVHIPWAKIWTRYCREVVPSLYNKKNMDHTVDSVVWLSNFRKQNEKLLSSNPELVTSKSYEWTKREVTPEGANILEIVDHGIERPPHAAECILVLTNELKRLTTIGKCRTIVVGDGINAFYHPVYLIKYPDKTWVPVENITVFEAFKNLFRSDWKGGIVVCSVDQCAVVPELRTSDLPRSLLTKKGWQDFDPFIPLEVPNYSSQEVQTTIDYFLDRKWLQHPLAGSQAGRLELEYVSTRNPLTLMILCNSR